MTTENTRYNAKEDIAALKHDTRGLEPDDYDYLCRYATWDGALTDPAADRAEVSRLHKLADDLAEPALYDKACREFRERALKMEALLTRWLAGESATAEGQLRQLREAIGAGATDSHDEALALARHLRARHDESLRGNRYFEFNVNDEATVVLTEAGAERYNTRFARAAPKFRGSLVVCELWRLMEDFGPGITHGGPIPFENNRIVLRKRC